MRWNSVPTGAHALGRAPLSFRSRLLNAFAGLSACLLGATAPAATPLVAPQQLTVTAANATGGAVYNLTLTPNKAGTSALISALAPLNTDAAKHGLIDALVWVPNAATGTLDLVVADLTKGQILRYAGPSYGVATTIYSYTKNTGPSNPVGLAVDPSGNLLVVSPSTPIDAKPGLWIIPVNKTTGVYGAPILVDHSFSGVRTLALAEVMVAQTPATAVGTAAPAWNAGDVLVLVGDTFDPRVIVYSKAAIQGVLARPTIPLSGPTSTAVAPKLFQNLVAAPFGMDVWPADATHGVSLLFTTIDGRIIRFDTRSAAFTGNFASGLGLGLQKIKVGMFAGSPYAFAAQLGRNGQIYQFGAPPASGTNKALAVLTQGLNAPVGLALTSSGSTPVSACIAPSSCSPLGPNVTTQITGPGAANIPPGATILEQSCTVPNDPRVTIAGTTWSCAPTTLDISTFCPGFPTTLLPASMCGHSGASGSAFGVIKATASLLDQNANDIYIQTSVDAALALPGPFDLPCQAALNQYGPLLGFAPRSDLPTIEGTIVEDATSPLFIDFTGLCDRSGGNTHVASMYAYGLGLNLAGLSGAATNDKLGGFVNTKFNNLNATIANSSAGGPSSNQFPPSAQITSQTVTNTLENYVTQSQNYFNSDLQNNVNGFSCALNSIASGDAYLRMQANNPGVFIYTQPAAGNKNPNPAGNFDARFANLYLTIAGDFTGVANMSWPTPDVPPCVTLTAQTNTVTQGNSTNLIFGTPAPQFSGTPLLTTPTSCTLMATDGTYTTPANVGTSGTVSTGPLTHPGTYMATLECLGATGTTASTTRSLATQTINVTSQPTLTMITLAPAGSMLLTNQSQQYTATGTYSDSSTRNLNGYVTWISSTSNAAITSPGGVATCYSAGPTVISATLGSVTGGTPLTCQLASPTLLSVSITPNTPQTLNTGDTQQFQASAAYSDGTVLIVTSQATWTSSMPQVATVTNGVPGGPTGGLVTAVSTGSTLLTASYGGVTSAPVSIGVNASGVTLTASPAGTTPTVYPLGSGVQLNWSASGLPPTAVCTLSSNATGAIETLPATGAAGPSGTLAVNDRVPETVTYSYSCTGTPTATVMVTYTLRTTYQYTGMKFGTAFAPYTTLDRVTVSMSVDSPLPANATLIDPTQYGNFQITFSDGVQSESPPAGADIFYRVSTDATGNIIGPWTVGFGVPGGLAVNTQYDTGNNGGYGFTGTNDDSFQHQSSSCTANCASFDVPPSTTAPGSWTKSDLETLHVVYGTTPIGLSPSALLTEIAVGGTPTAPTFATSILNQVPEPTTCAAPGNPTAPNTPAKTAITSLVYTPNTPGGTSDLVAANGGYGDVFRMNGPSYATSYDVNDTSTGCWPNGPVAVGVAADGSGNVVGVGHDLTNTTTPAVYLFPNNTPGTAQTTPNFVLIDNVNSDPSLVPATCNPIFPAPVGCVGKLVDAVVVRTANPTNGLAAGDLLILAGDTYSTASTNPIVMKIPAAVVQLAANYATNCNANAYDVNSSTPTPCVTNANNSTTNTGATLGVTPASFATVGGLGSSESPVSLDISPVDGSLLIGTSAGRILQLQAAAGGFGTATTFASQLSGLQKIRAGQRGSTTSYVFATVQQTSAMVTIFVGSGPFSSATATIPVSDLVGGLAVQGLPVSAQ